MSELRVRLGLNLGLAQGLGLALDQGPELGRSLALGPAHERTCIWVDRF